MWLEHLAPRFEKQTKSRFFLFFKNLQPTKPSLISRCYGRFDPAGEEHFAQSPLVVLVGLAGAFDRDGEAQRACEGVVDEGLQRGVVAVGVEVKRAFELG